MIEITLRVSWYLAQAARWLILAILIMAPWLFGGTRAWTIQITVAALFTACGLWLLGRAGEYAAGRRGSPWGIPAALLVLSIFAALFGWMSVWNAEAFLDPYLGRFVAIPHWTKYLPASVDAEISRSTMGRISALLLAMLFSCYMAHRPEWRRRLLASLAGAGISIAIFGVMQKIGGGPLLFWEPERFGAVSFAMYRYYGNAAAYLNLVWPIGVAFAIDAFQRTQAPFARAFWLPGAIVMIVAVGVNLSKGGHFVAVILLLMGALLSLIACSHSRFNLRLRSVFPPTLLAITVAALISIIGYQEAIVRWKTLIQNPSTQQARLRMARVCLEIAQERPWVGFGPGTFSAVFPFYSARYGDKLPGTWRYAHSDYPQMLLEWGRLGGLIWAAIFWGGIVRAILFFKAACTVSSAGTQLRESGRRWAMLQNGAIFLSLSGVAIHALFDFPLQITSIQLYVAVLLGCAWRGKP